MHNTQWIALTLLGSILTGCGTTQTAPAPPIITPIFPPSPPVLSKALLQTCIPHSDHYVTLIVDSAKPTVYLTIGHPLSSQGSDLPESHWAFSGHAGRVAVTIPTNVVFEMVPNGSLWGDVVDQHGSLWLLFYVTKSRPTTVTVFGRASWLAKGLSIWSPDTRNVQSPPIQQAMATARRDGWSIRMTIKASRHLTGVGVDGWLPLRSDQPVNLFNPAAGGNVAFEVAHFSAQTPRVYATVNQGRCPLMPQK